MTQLANFFDDPLQRKTSSKEIPIPQMPLSEISNSNFSFGLASAASSCPCDSLWLDAYGIWRCEICFPPIFENEIRERKKIHFQEISSPKISPTEKIPAEEISLVNFVPRYFLNDEFLFAPENQEPPCDTCGSLAFWWNIPGTRFCQRCHPRPKRSRELLELVPKLRAAAKLAKTKPTAK